MPCAGVGEQRGAVEEVAEEGGGEERGAESCGAAPDLVLVELREARAQVEQGGGPGEDFAEEVARGLGVVERRRGVCGPVGWASVPEERTAKIMLM